MKVKKLYISEKLKIINLKGSEYLGYETEFDKYTFKFDNVCVEQDERNEI